MRNSGYSHLSKEFFLGRSTLIIWKIIYSQDVFKGLDMSKFLEVLNINTQNT